jgi:hypothetical protein
VSQLAEASRQTAPPGPPFDNSAPTNIIQLYRKGVRTLLLKRVLTPFPIIAGDHPEREKLMQLLLMRLIGQKRELLRANGSFIKDIIISKVEEPEEE